MARRSEHICYGIRHGCFITRAGVKASEDVEFHAVSRLLLLSLTTMTASQLRAKYGPAGCGTPLDRETFTISPGLEIVVDYGADEKVKRIELPGTAPDQSGRRRSVSVCFDEHHQSSSTS